MSDARGIVADSSASAVMLGPAQQSADLCAALDAV
jgi:hypothetical protein